MYYCICMLLSVLGLELGLIFPFFFKKGGGHTSSLNVLGLETGLNSVEKLMNIYIYNTNRACSRHLQTSKYIIYELKIL